MTTQPEALQLADILQHKLPSIECLEVAAAELRRLHEVNTELLSALKAAKTIIGHPDDSTSKYIASAINKAERTTP